MAREESGLTAHRVFVLLSGGVDSTTTLAIARNDFPTDDIEAVTVDYGQRHSVERDYALHQAIKYHAHFTTMPIKGLMSGMLVGDGEAVPDKSYAELGEGISPTYVSFRNGLMLSALAARAQGWIMHQEALWMKCFNADTQGDFGKYQGVREASATIYCGVHADDGVGWAYPDCTPEFVGSMANAIHIGTYFKVRVRAPLQYYSKADVVRHGARLNVDYGQTWSCYKGGEEHCGTCPTCQSRKEAFKIVGIEDPTRYSA